MHSGTYDAAWPVRVPPTTGAATSSPRRQHGGTSPAKVAGQQGRSGDSYNSSRDGNNDSRSHRSGQRMTRCSDDRSETSSSNSSSRSSTAPARRPKKEDVKENPGSSDVTALKTPWRVILPLVDVSPGHQVHLRSRNECAVADRAVPLSSTTAHARHAQIDSDNAAQEIASIAAV